MEYVGRCDGAAEEQGVNVQADELVVPHSVQVRESGILLASSISIARIRWSKPQRWNMIMSQK